MSRRKSMWQTALCVCALLALAAACQRAPAAEGLIVVDASRDGGVWWFPQTDKRFNYSKPHQGQALADYLRSRGWEVKEITPKEKVDEQLKGAKLVIRANFYGAGNKYEESEAKAYQDYVEAGGRLLLLQGSVEENWPNPDLVAKQFGIKFAGVRKAQAISRWSDHRLTAGLDRLIFNTGSAMVESPAEMVPVAYLEKDLAMGIVKAGKGKVFASSAILPFLAVPQPFTQRLIKEMTEEFEGSH